MTESRVEQKNDEHEFGKPGWFDWLSRMIARAVFRIPRIAPSRFKQKKLGTQWADLKGEPFDVAGKDGVRIHGVRFAGKVMDGDGVKGAKPQAAGGDEAHARLPIVFSHGWTEVKEYHQRLARLLTSRGHDFVIYDQRAHGQSKAKCTTLSVRERDDLHAVIEEATRRGWLPGQYLLMGVSMGGATVLRYAARQSQNADEGVDRVAGIVAYAPFASFLAANRSFKQRIFRFANSDWIIRGSIQASQKWGFDIREASPIDCVADINAPILYIVGEKDRYLPAEHHTEKLAAVTDSEWVIVPEATHVNICFRAWESADEAMLRFVRTVGDAGDEAMRSG